ncbi:MAG: single-stranded-DNA-specific exonuclease RecJ [Candidatus Lambdaproteobacteria bacterium]|nr:single-stranded-DNA-specific exonuclease RecJ [Candidatus Lambdaproteobacteria bacterium]
MSRTQAITNTSLSGQVWVEAECPVADEIVRALSARLEVSEPLARILAARKLSDLDAAHRFLHPGDQQLHPPFLLKGMAAAVARILRALDHYEKILVFGDYDVDGTASAAILYSYLRRVGAKVFYFIPNRLDDGYGVNATTVGKIAGWKVDLVITTDHGSTAHEGALALRRLGIDLIVTDHHQTGGDLPQTAALVNPQQPECPYPFKELSAAGVAFKVACALDERLTEQHFWEHQGLQHVAPAYYLDLVALATVADMSPLVGENRTLVALGLALMNQHARPGLAGLLKESNVRRAVTANVITFKLAPKINALGRVGDPGIGMQMLLTHSYTEARRLGRTLVDMNRRRQEIERQVLHSAMEQMEAAPLGPATILVGEAWHPGVLGSIASRMAFHSRKPTVVLTQSFAPQVLGSARGYDSYNILEVLQACADLLDRFGGHPAAAGLALNPCNLEPFVVAFARAVDESRRPSDGEGGRQLLIDAWISPEVLHSVFIAELDRLSPFGMGNPEPVLALRAVRLENPTVFNQRHLRFTLDDGGGLRMEAFAWGHSDWPVDPAARYDVAFVPQVAESNGRLQLKVVDLKCCG